MDVNLTFLSRAAAWLWDKFRSKKPPPTQNITVNIQTSGGDLHIAKEGLKISIDTTIPKFYPKVGLYVDTFKQLVDLSTDPLILGAVFEGISGMTASMSGSKESEVRERLNEQYSKYIWICSVCQEINPTDSAKCRKCGADRNAR